MEPAKIVLTSNLQCFVDIQPKELTYGRILGEGSFGTVYLGEWRQKDKVQDVAIKQLQIKKIPDEMLKEFNREVQIMQGCDFPNVMKLFGVCLKDNQFAIVMDYMEKGSLYDVLHNPQEVLPWIQTRWQFALDIGKGLEYLHSKKIIHRDLKSFNVLIANNLQAKIADFGLSKTISTMSHLTVQPRSRIGSTRWMAPELFIQDEMPSFASDVYALGMILNEIVTRQIPYEGQNDDQTVIHWIKTNVKPKISMECPKDYLETLNDCLIFDARDRPSATSVVKQLEVAYEKDQRRSQKSNPSQVSSYPSERSDNNNSHGSFISTYQMPTAKDSNISASSSMIGKSEFTLLEENYQIGWSFFLKAQYTQALPYFKKVAEFYPPALLRLRWLYGYGGRVGPKNIPEKDSWGRKAAEKFNWFKEQAEISGKPEAQYDLAICYDMGLGVAKDEKQAVIWYQKAADQGLLVALTDLGISYFAGTGVTKNLSLAKNLFEEAATKENAMAQYNLGICYFQGLGVTKNAKEAFNWIQKAADQGYAEAQFRLARCYRENEGITKDDKQAAYWALKSAEQGHMQAQCFMGYCFKNGVGVALDYKISFYWNQKAAEQDSAPAQYNLGLLYAFGHGVNQDDEQAKHWFIKAAEQGDADAQYELGIYHSSVIRKSEMSKETFEYNKKQAIIWLEKAAKLGHKKALNELKFVQARLFYECIIS